MLTPAVLTVATVPCIPHSRCAHRAVLTLAVLTLAVLNLAVLNLAVLTLAVLTLTLAVLTLDELVFSVSSMPVGESLTKPSLTRYLPCPSPQLSY